MPPPTAGKPERLLERGVTLKKAIRILASSLVAVQAEQRARVKSGDLHLSSLADPCEEVENEVAGFRHYLLHQKQWTLEGWLQAGSTPLDEKTRGELCAVFRRRLQFEPWSQIQGSSPFFGHHFLVNADVLTPRADSEVLVEEALNLFESETFQNTALDEGQASLQVLDLCCGSGCLALAFALSLKQESRSLALHFVDLSPKALEVARHNAQQLGLAHISDFWQKDLLQADSPWQPFKRQETNATETVEPTQNQLPGQVPKSDKPHHPPLADLVFFNPPYISKAEMEGLSPEVRLYEPRMALTDEGDGLQFYRILFQHPQRYLKPGGFLVLEHGYRQREAVKRIGQEAGWSLLHQRQDYGHHDRCMVWQAPLETRVTVTSPPRLQE